jgi:polar amino acid transport system substrate-binding protein
MTCERSAERRVLALLIVATAWLWAAPASASAPLRVGAAGSEPFVVGSGSQVDGLSVAVWRAAAAKAKLSFELTRAPSVRGALDAVRDGKLDVVVGPVSITAARARTVRFTQPYFQARLSILAPATSAGPWSRVKPFLTKAFAAGVGLLLLVLLGVGTLFWLAERRRNPEQFPEKPAAGIANGVWLAVVTMTTVGYGDRVPLSGAGRVIASIWMIVALISASSLTAGIATALTLSQLDRAAISRLDELDGRRVAVVAGTTGASLAESHGARLVKTPNLEQAVERVIAGKADAVVFDRPMLQYYLKQHPDVGLQLSQGAWQPQGYGFAAKNDDALVRSLNVALLELEASGQTRSIANKWLGAEQDGS